MIVTYSLLARTHTLSSRPHACPACQVSVLRRLLTFLHGSAHHDFLQLHPMHGALMAPEPRECWAHHGRPPESCLCPTDDPRPGLPTSRQGQGGRRSKGRLETSRNSASPTFSLCLTRPVSAPLTSCPDLSPHRTKNFFPLLGVFAGKDHRLLTACGTEWFLGHPRPPQPGRAERA